MKIAEPTSLLSQTPKVHQLKAQSVSMGAALGTIAVPERICTKAARVADEFWMQQFASDFSEQVDTMHSKAMPLDWLPHAQLRQLGYRADMDKHHWVMTTGVEAHIDRDFGLTLMWVLVNDGLFFRQGRQKHVHAPGQWFVFDDYASHAVDLSKACPKKAVFIGWAVKLIGTSMRLR